jgi:hypothetical protein
VVHSTNFDESSAEGEPTSLDASTSEEAPQAGGDRDRQRARLYELDEAQKALEEEQARLHHALGAEAAATPMCERAQELRCCIISDVHGTPVAKRASQNLAAAAVLLRAGPEPMTP